MTDPPTAADSCKGNENNNDTNKGKRKKTIVVVKRRKVKPTGSITSIAANKRRLAGGAVGIRRATIPTKAARGVRINGSGSGGIGRGIVRGRGIPTFRPRLSSHSALDGSATPSSFSGEGVSTQPTTATAAAHADHTNKGGDDEFSDTFDVEDGIAEGLPSDTLMVMQSLKQASQGLHIPLLQNGSMTVQVVLELQIFQKFQASHASNTNGELQQLIQTSKIRRLSCQNIHSSGLILMDDYVAGVWDAFFYHQLSSSQFQDLINWFVTNMKEWTGITISKQSMEEFWEGITLTKDPDNNESVSRKISLDEALQFLLKIQVLIRDPASLAGSERFYLWLPQWGLVLKAWNEGRQQLLGVVARSKGGEISEQNLLHQNRHAAVSTKFLLEELVHNGKARVIDRPFGRFVQRVK